MDAVTHRREIESLSERLVLEFGTLMPPGQILRIVHQANRLVLQAAGEASHPVVLCEAIARDVLRERIAGIKYRGTASA